MRPAVLVLLLACGPERPQADACKPGDNSSLEIGSGETSFEAVSEGSEVILVHGPQGGYHVEVGLRATYIDASQLLAGTIEGTLDGERVAVAKPWLDFRCNPETESLDSWGTQLIYSAGESDIPFADLDEQVTTITATFVDAAGVEHSASTTFTIQDPSIP